MHIDEFLQWERVTRDTIDFKAIYVDMAGDLMAGLLLSQIVFWHLPDRSGNSKLQVRKDGYMWIARSNSDWWEETRMTTEQARRAMGILVKSGLVETDTHRFNGTPTTHVRILEDAFLHAWNEALATPPVNPNRKAQPELQSDSTWATAQVHLGQPPSPLGLQPKSLTETTTETTSEKKNAPSATSLAPAPADNNGRIIIDLNDVMSTLETQGISVNDATALCECGAMLSQKGNCCPDCGREVVWLNSRIWKREWGKPENVLRDRSWERPGDGYTLGVFGRLGIAKFDNQVRSEEWHKLLRDATTEEMDRAVDFVVRASRESGYGGLAHLMNLASKIVRERPEVLPQNLPSVDVSKFVGYHELGAE